MTRSISQLDGDQLRSIADDVPGNLEDCTLLLVRAGNEPVREYVHGDGEGIRKAGDLAGFSISPLPGTANPNCRKESADQLTLLCHGRPA